MFAVFKRPASTLSMQTGGQDKPVSIAAFQKSVSEAWFASPAVFAMKALTMPLVVPTHLTDTSYLRGLLVCQALKLFPTVTKCPTNPRHKVKLEETHDRFQWTCSVRGHKCFRAGLCPVGLLSNVRPNSWLAFLYFVNGLRLNIRWTKLATDIDEIFGTQDPKTLRRWRGLYQEALEVFLHKHNHLVLGSTAGDVVVFDETNMGNSGGISKAATAKETHHKPNKIQRDRIVKRLPARTLHRPASCLRRPAASSSTSACKRPAACRRQLKRPAAVMKSVFNKGIAGSSKDQRTGRWLFAAVLVGNKSTRYTHGNGRKRFTFHIMDLPKAAPDGKPSGIKSMKKAILKCISPKAFVVHDKWKASAPALAEIGLKAAPPVNHSQGWRDRATGFNSNDIESEFSRLKRSVRERYGRLSFQSQGADDSDDVVDAGDLYEYTFKTNVGNRFFDVLKALQLKSPC